MAGNGNTKHGGCHTRLYTIWKTMRQRCLNPNNGRCHLYGGNGISICEEWNDFSKFRNWSISNGYADNLTIDRIDSKGNYEPSNCRWTTQLVQQNNKRSNRIISYKGESMTMAEFCRQYNLKYKLFAKYVKNGMSIEDAIEKAGAEYGRTDRHFWLFGD